MGFSSSFVGIYFTTLLECDPRKGQLGRVLSLDYFKYLKQAACHVMHFKTHVVLVTVEFAVL